MDPMEVEETSEDVNNSSVTSAISESLKEFFNITDPSEFSGPDPIFVDDGEISQSRSFQSHSLPTEAPQMPKNGPGSRRKSRTEKWNERRLRLALRRRGGLKDSVLSEVTQEYEEDEIDGRILFEQAFPFVGQKHSVLGYAKEMCQCFHQYVTSRRPPSHVAGDSGVKGFSPSRSFPPSVSTEVIVSPDIDTDDVVDLPSPEMVGESRRSPGTGIESRYLGRLSDNSDRRQYGVGALGRLFQRQVDGSIVKQPHVKQQLDDLTDFRPYFTYWISFVHIVVMVITILWYGIGPFGAGLTRSTGLVMTEFLTLEQVDVRAPGNFWLGPPARDLIHLGAKYTPCMRPYPAISQLVQDERTKEASETGCCIKNDRSGCVQTVKDNCSPFLSTFVKWNSSEPGVGGRISGPVCGQDPRFCLTPISSGVNSWPDDIGQWPVCHQNIMSEKNYSIGAPSHMSCEVLAKPCCIGIHGRCELRSEEFCRWVGGTLHREANLCSQVSCIGDVCGMLPFAQKDVPDQFYRLWTSLFLNAGLFQLMIVVVLQLYLMRDLEKMCGPLRLSIIYFGSGIIGNLASAIFIPYRAECGPSGALFGILATFIIEVVKAWRILRRPSLSLLELSGVMIFLIFFGMVPWVDNYAHVFGFFTGLLLSYALLPHINFDKTPVSMSWQVFRVSFPLLMVVALFLMLTILFYSLSLGDCEVCKLLSCIPIVADFCAEQNIDYTVGPRSLF
ncbi:hypothetical protein TCAL_00668 [Tigriopus californicus]|uniref:Peptidase S54 rhomboid domain-containing protein n=2 Tax=Tigriopus californicus TaxID=6832 RepID=A0A553PBS5_TIGCA|nr:hypothetical protein TCAL_00668 [Tigriopus californicus]